MNHLVFLGLLAGNLLEAVVQACHQTPPITLSPRNGTLCCGSSITLCPLFIRPFPCLHCLGCFFFFFIVLRFCNSAALHGIRCTMLDSSPWSVRDPGAQIKLPIIFILYNFSQHPFSASSLLFFAISLPFGAVIPNDPNVLGPGSAACSSSHQTAARLRLQ